MEKYALMVRVKFNAFKDLIMVTYWSDGSSSYEMI